MVQGNAFGGAVGIISSCDMAFAVKVDLHAPPCGRLRGGQQRGAQALFYVTRPFCCPGLPGAAYRL